MSRNTIDRACIKMVAQTVGVDATGPVPTVAARVLEKFAEISEVADWATGHAAALDRNWHAHHEATLGAVRASIGLGPDASVPEMVAAVRRLRATAPGES